jgi:hypothetical protein
MSDNDDSKKPTPSLLETGTRGDAPNGSPAGSKPLLNRAVQAQIGQRLRHFYESLALGEQPVPDRFIELINRLDQTRLDHSEKPQ